MRAAIAEGHFSHWKKDLVFAQGAEARRCCRPQGELGGELGSFTED